MKKRKKLVLAAVFVVLVFLINQLLNYMLVQPGLARTIFYECRQGGYECVLLGASHGSYGYSTEEISEKLGLKTMNMCMGGEYMNDAYYVLKYAMEHNKIKVVILDIDYQYLVNQHDESILFNSVYNAYPNGFSKLPYFADRMAWEEFRGTFLRWTNYWQCYYMIDQTIEKKRSAAYRNYSPEVVSMNPYDTYRGNGFIFRDKAYEKSMTSCIEWDEQKVSQDECKYIKKIVNLCKKNDIQIVFTSICQDPETIAAQAEKFAGADRYIRNMAQELEVPYLNFNCLKFQVFERTTDDFYDREGHMYGETAEQFSSIMGQVVHETLAGTCDENMYFDTDMQRLYSY